MEFPVTLVRALIEVPTVKFGMIKENGNNIGYLRIIEFTPQTPERVQQALDSFKEDDFSGLIIDLRNNPGGLITSVVDVADKFIDSGPIVSTKSRHSYENSVYTASSRRTTMPKNIPIVVLINKGSASASEILSGALKDNHLAYLVGERTYGKGSVQQVVPLPNSDGIKLTMARYYTPSDSNIDKIGIPPDLIVKMPELSEEEEKIYIELITSTEIADYVESHPNMTEAHITAYAKQLGYKYKMNQLYLRRLVKLEVYRTRTQPLYDLDFDIQLNEAINVVKSSNFKNLLKMTKTLKELQEIAAKEVEIADKK
jgi:carboxyl-terminal processing protease